MEPNRIWHEPEVIIYGNLITPGMRCSAEAYDVANRKWYQLNVDSEIEDDEWMSRFIEKHITKYYHAYGKMPSFNVINANQDGNLTGFDTRPDNVIARRVGAKLYYSNEATNAITTTTSDQLFEKVFVSRAVDRCLWRGRDCVFKRIEFDVDVKNLNREIETREHLIKTLNLHTKDNEVVMEQQFNVIPILAVVLKQGGNNEVVGILMPFGGPSLESLFESVPISASLSNKSTDIAITAGQLRDLARGVRELARAGVVHGDINSRNTLLKPIIPACKDIYHESHRLVMVDFGSLAPDYKTDAFALGQLFIWCSERSSWDIVEQRRIEIAAQILQNSGDFDRALDVMDNNLASDHKEYGKTQD